MYNYYVEEKRKKLENAHKIIEKKEYIYKQRRKSKFNIKSSYRIGRRSL